MLRSIQCKIRRQQLREINWIRPRAKKQVHPALWFLLIPVVIFIGIFLGAFAAYLLSN